MTPLEIVGKAILLASDHHGVRRNKMREDGKQFEVFCDQDQIPYEPVVVAAFADEIEAHKEAYRLNGIHQARVALMALVECELSRGAITDGANLISLEGGEYWKEKAELSFRAMLRSIANEGKNDG